MKLEEARDVLVTHMKNGWESRVVVTPVFYDNVTDLDVTDLKSFIRFVPEFLAARQANVAVNPYTRRYGTVSCHVFVRTNTGTKFALNLADELTELFEYATLGGLHLQATSPSAPNDRNGWYSIELRTPFYFDSNA